MTTFLLSLCRLLAAERFGVDLHVLRRAQTFEYAFEQSDFLLVYQACPNDGPGGCDVDRGRARLTQTPEQGAVGHVVDEAAPWLHLQQLPTDRFGHFVRCQRLGPGRDRDTVFRSESRHLIERHSAIEQRGELVRRGRCAAKQHMIEVRRNAA